MAALVWHSRFAIRDWTYVLPPLVEEKRVRGAVVQSCCPAREVVELKVGAQVMLLKVRKNKEKSPSGLKLILLVQLTYGFFTLMWKPRIAFPAILRTPGYDNKSLHIRPFHGPFQLNNRYTNYLVPFPLHF